jgi:peptidoglycan/LPS O-acetylase OafA/YrhL
MTARFGLFYALGVLAGPWLLRGAAALPGPRAAAMAASLALVWALAAFAAGAGGQAYTSVAALPAALAGGAAVIVFATLPRGAMGRLWILLGQASMAIFLLHVLFVAGVRITLHKLLGVEAPGLIFVLSCGAGIAGPLLVRRLARRVHAARALGLG